MSEIIILTQVIIGYITVFSLIIALSMIVDLLPPTGTALLYATIGVVGLLSPGLIVILAVRGSWKGLSKILDFLTYTLDSEPYRSEL